MMMSWCFSRRPTCWSRWLSVAVSVLLHHNVVSFSFKSIAQFSRSSASLQQPSHAGSVTSRSDPRSSISRWDGRDLAIRRKDRSFGTSTSDTGNFKEVNAEGWELTLKSPCKLNLFLRILGRRPNGFHDLASLFQTVSLADTLSFSKISSTHGVDSDVPIDPMEDEMICSDPMLQVDKSNLVIKALELMRERTGMRDQFFRVYLEKRVPMQAGLGGGSGNAATAMQAFNMLCGYPASQEQLLEWSGEIGSDISFFFSSGTAYCTGRGEVVRSLSPLPHADEVEVLIVKPREGLSTGSVFQALDLDACSPVIPESILHCFQTGGALAAARDGRLINDLEAPAFSVQPKLSDIKALLESFETAEPAEPVEASSSKPAAEEDEGKGEGKEKGATAQWAPSSSVAGSISFQSQKPQKQTQAANRADVSTEAAAVTRAAGLGAASSASGVVSGAMMSGSGTSVYALLRRSVAAAAVEGDKVEKVHRAVREMFPDAAQFRCSFIQRDATDPTSWY